MQKQFINAANLLEDSFELALKILASDFRPNLIVGVWRGGSPIGIAIQEALEFAGVKSDHIAIRTSSYTNIDQRSQVTVQGLEYIQQHVSTIKSILLVDDVFDTGLSLHQVIKELNSIYGEELANIKIATPYFKPDNNRTERSPDFYLHETKQWLVFPHELIGLSDEEIISQKADMGSTYQRLLKLRPNTKA